MRLDMPNFSKLRNRYFDHQLQLPDTEQSKLSQVVLFRKITDGVVETHVLNLKSMLDLKQPGGRLGH